MRQQGLWCVTAGPRCLARGRRDGGVTPGKGRVHGGSWRAIACGTRSTEAPPTGVSTKDTKGRNCPLSFIRVYRCSSALSRQGAQAGKLVPRGPRRPAYRAWTRGGISACKFARPTFCGPFLAASMCVHLRFRSDSPRRPRRTQRGRGGYDKGGVAACNGEGVRYNHKDFGWGRGWPGPRDGRQVAARKG